MLIAMPLALSFSVNSRLVNWAALVGVHDLGHLPWRVIASSSTSTQKSAVSVFESRKAGIRRFAQSIAAQK
jgi:hypothetical protein